MIKKISQVETKLTSALQEPAVDIPSYVSLDNGVPLNTITFLSKKGERLFAGFITATPLTIAGQIYDNINGQLSLTGTIPIPTPLPGNNYVIDTVGASPDVKLVATIGAQTDAFYNQLPGELLVQVFDNYANLLYSRKMSDFVDGGITNGGWITEDHKYLIFNYYSLTYGYVLAVLAIQAGLPLVATIPINSAPFSYAIGPKPVQVKDCVYITMALTVGSTFSPPLSFSVFKFDLKCQKLELVINGPNFYTIPGIDTTYICKKNVLRIAVALANYDEIVSGNPSPIIQTSNTPPGTGYTDMHNLQIFDLDLCDPCNPCLSQIYHRNICGTLIQPINWVQNSKGTLLSVCSSLTGTLDTDTGAGISCGTTLSWVVLEKKELCKKYKSRIIGPIQLLGPLTYAYNQISEDGEWYCVGTSITAPPLNLYMTIGATPATGLNTILLYKMKVKKS